MALVAIPEMKVKENPLANVKSVDAYREPGFFNSLAKYIPGGGSIVDYFSDMNGKDFMRGGLSVLVGQDAAKSLVPMPTPAPEVSNTTNPNYLTKPMVADGQVNATSQNASADRIMPEAAKVNQAANGMSGQDLSKILGGLSSSIGKKSFTPFSLGQVQINARPISFLGRG